MEIEQELKALYRPKFFTLYTSNAKIKEIESCSVLKEIELISSGEILVIDKELLDGSKSIYIKKEENPLIDIDHVCDGIVVLENTDKEGYIFIVELKSACSCTNLLKAKNQIKACYIKLSAMLHPFEKIDIKKYKVAGITVSMPLNVEEKVKLDKRAKQDELKGCKMSSARFCLNLTQKGYMIIPGNPEEKAALPFLDEVYFDSLPLFHIGYNGTPINLGELCKQLVTLH